MSKRGQNWSLLGLALGGGLLALGTVELGLRFFLFSPHSPSEAWRVPGMYADPERDDDYWILYFKWDRRYEPPGTTQPALGWVYQFDRETLEHHDAAALAGRRPVLLYGDSFAACVDGVPCFEELTAEHPLFVQDHRLLNYGVGGYGLDQVMVLAEGSLPLHPAAPVVISIMPLDLDRASLCVRVGQKPCFSLTDSGIVSRGPPIAKDAWAWFSAAEPSIRWWSGHRLLFSAWTPEAWRRALRRSEAHEAELAALNAAFIERIIAALDARDHPRLWVIFNPHHPGHHRTLTGAGDWRDAALEGALQRRHAETVVWTRDLLRAVEQADGPLRVEDWIDPANGHPTEAYNRLVTRALTDWVAALPEPG